MLQPPYTAYDRLYTYHLDLPELPELDDPDLIGVWLEDESAVLFFHRPKERLIEELCRRTGAGLIYQADLTYDEWEAGREIAPFTVAGLTVAPVWAAQQAEIKLDPSVIFGSGFHPSTRLCLEMLLKYLAAPESNIASALDLGCGTGLLAIAAARRGVERVVGIDHNPLACKVAQANCARNGVEKLVTIRQADLRQKCPDTDGFDLVIANLYQGLMAELFAREAFWQARFHILAGFISPMEEKLLAAVPGSQLRFLERNSRDRWCVWVLANRARGF
ncbi:50S ribosomal protein L11 methyltransferase [Desulfurivibrio sp. D14AmB]|uniref:50S ribosomal protein L11 methyltransferase n=1 Tax=Desulfurivibrio sp. D14AmB TaxID=3374370 RepID=UPI00376EB202